MLAHGGGVAQCKLNAREITERYPRPRWGVAHCTCILNFFNLLMLGIWVSVEVLTAFLVGINGVSVTAKEITERHPRSRWGRGIHVSPQYNSVYQPQYVFPCGKGVVRGRGGQQLELN